MLERDKMENEYRDLFRRYKMGTTIFSPLRCGILTGKYIDQTPDDSRANSKNPGIKKMMEGFDYFKNKEVFDKKLKELKDFAEKKLNCSLAQLAIAWTIVNPDVSTCIIGATKASQVEENCKSLEVVKKLDKETLIEIEKILDNAPKGEIDFRTWKELPSRRNIALGLDYVKK